MFFPNKPDEDWYWPVEILRYTSAFFTLFDLSLRGSLFNFNSVFAVFMLPITLHLEICTRKFGMGFFGG